MRTGHGDLFRTLCGRWDITFIEPDDLFEHSASTYKDIWLGIYKDPEQRLFAFFHELGHCVNSQEKNIPPYEEWPYGHYHEALAWKRGLALAAEEGITFSDESLAWAARQLRTYFHEDHPEKTSLEHFPQALRDAGLPDID